MPDGSAHATPRDTSLRSLLAPRRPPTTPGPSYTPTRNSKPRLPAEPRGWERLVTWALEPDNWTALRDRLPPLLLAMMPPEPPRDRATAWRVLYETMWLRATGQPALVPYLDKAGALRGAYAPPVEHDTAAVFGDGTLRSVTMCVRPAPIVKLERSRWHGWRFAPEILTASFSDGPEGEEDERSDYRAAGHLGGDIAWDGVQPAPRRTQDPPVDRKGLARFDYGGDVVLLEVESITKIGADGWLTSVALAAPPTDWRGVLVRHVKQAKARLLEFESNGGPNPRIRPADVLRAAKATVAIPSWVTPPVVGYLIAVISWASGGKWQCSADTMIEALRSQKSLARFALRQLERVAVLHFDPTPGADNQHSCDTLRRAHELVDVVMGESRKPQVAFRMRVLELQNTSDPARVAARADRLRLYRVALE